VTATYARPADNTAYGIGDLIGNSGTAASVVPISFANIGRVSGGSGRLFGARCVVSAASGTIVLPAFDLLVFRPEASVPFAAAGFPADNAALNISLAAMRELIGVFTFSATAWRNQAGGATAAGPAVWQAAKLADARAYAAFNLLSVSSPPGGAGGQALVALMQAQNAWTPTGVVNTFDFALDLDQD
jgi:hypothetical protein